MNRSTVLRSALLAPFVIAAVACGGGSGEEGSSPAAAADGMAMPGPDGGPGSVGATGSDGGSTAVGTNAPGATIDVHGTVTSYADVPIVGRTVRVVDAKGNHMDVVTDSAGGFAAAGVVTPYDVRVSAEGLTDAASVYLGIAEAAPYLHGEVATTSQTAVTQTFNVAVLLATACNGCGVDFVTRSAHGSGGTTATFAAGSSAANASFQHQFVSDGSPSEAVTIHVLVHDAARTWFRYAEASLTAVAGRTSPGGVYSPALVPVHPFTASVQSPGVPANWHRELLTALVLADGAAINLCDTREQPSLSTNVPVIPGAALSTASWLIDPIGDSDSSIADDVQTWTGNLPISGASVVLSPTTPLHDVIPGPKSSISLKGPGLSWTAPPSTVTTVTLFDVTHSRGVVTIFTDGNTATWERLEALGVAVAAGELHVLLSTPSHSGLAAVVAGDATKRDVFSRSVAGSSSYQRWPFTLTP